MPIPLVIEGQSTEMVTSEYRWLDEYHRLKDNLPIMVTIAKVDFTAGQALPHHHHDEGQILFARTGTLDLVADEKLYVLPASRAAWIPPKQGHQIRFRTHTQLRTVYIPAAQIDDRMHRTQILQVTDLFRALMLRLVEDGDMGNIFRRKLEDLLILELLELPSEQFYLALPSDKRILKVAHALLENPADNRKLDDWAAMAACSSKTMSRLFSKQTGQTFRLWRRQARLLAALDYLEAGNSITETAHQIGFSTSSAFTEAFRLTFGYPPTKR